MKKTLTPGCRLAAKTGCFLPIFLLLSTALPAQFNTNGTASGSGGGCYTLTEDIPAQAGSILSTNSVNLAQPFNQSATLYFGTKDNDGADGIVFLFATTNGALGIGGGGIGYEGITPSVGIEMDTWQNGNYGDPVADHMAIISNGNMNHSGPTNLAGPIALPNIEDGADHCFTVSWNPATQTLQASLDGSTITYVGDITGILGTSNVFWGFTASTGAATNVHRVCVGASSITPMVDIDICPGQSAVLMPDPNGLTYSWAPNPTLSNPNIQNPTATPTVTTTYSVTITFACGGALTDDVIVNVVPPPAVNASNDSPACEGDDVQLSTGGGTGYDWSGPGGFSSSIQNPVISDISLAQAGTYTVTVTNATGCTATASTLVTVHPLPVVIILPPPALCEDDPTTTLGATPPGGSWGGAANALGEIDPGALGAGSHLVTYTFTNANGCTNEAELFVVINPIPVVVINPAGPFCASDPPQTLTASPSGGFWGGAANAFGQVDPQILGAGSHLVTYSYIEGTGCAASANFIVQIQAAPTVFINPAGPFCPSAPPQALSASPPGGVWGGAANAAGQINPAALGTGIHSVTYTFTTANGCTGDASLDISILPLPTAQISGGGTICAGSGQTVPVVFTVSGIAPLVLTFAIENVAQPLLTLTSGSTTLPASVPGTYTIVSINDNNGCTNTGSGTAEVIVVGAPALSNIDFDCNAANTEYVVTFTLSGGDAGSYAVSGSPGTLSGSTPFIFTSQPIASGTAYSFTVNDANNCSPTTLSGDFSCGCATEAGTMNPTLISVCQNQPVTATHNGNEVLDANDSLIFVLHDGNGNVLGIIFGMGVTPSFSFAPPMLAGVTYFISAVAGDADLMIGVDLSDACLSVSLGTPVVFNPLPGVAISGDEEICNGESAALTFSLSGNAPFDLTYSDGGQNFTLNNILDGHSLVVSPAMTTTYSLVSVSDNSMPACSSASAGSATVTVWQPASFSQNISICQGESVFLQGANQTVAGTFHDTLSTSHGCDSVVISTLFVNELDTTFLGGTSCNPANVGVFTQNLTNQNGCDSLIVTTIAFSQTDTTLLATTTCDPAAAGVFVQNFTTPEGCDSVTVTTVSLLPSDEIFLFDASCNPASVGVFTQNLSNQFGCDSTVVTTISFSLTDTTLLASTTCDPAAAGVFSQNFTTPEGCDSTVIETVTLLSGDQTSIASTTCDPAAAGIFTHFLTNQNGCDSIVIETINLAPKDTTFLFETTCDATQAGFFTQNLTNQAGCDSLVFSTVVFSNTDTTLLSATTCDPTAAGVFVQHFNTPTGCDSVIVTTVSLLPGDTTTLNFTTCDPAAVGTDITILPNQNGCDSVVFAVTTLLPPDACGIAATLDDGIIPCGSTTGELVLTPTVGEAPFAFVWSGGGDTGSGVAGLFEQKHITGLAAGNYSVTLTSANGFSVVLTSFVSPFPLPVISVNALSDFNGFGVPCAGEAGGSISVSASGGPSPFDFLWSNGAAGAQLFNLQAGSYTVTVSNGGGCTATAEVTLTEPPSLHITFTVNNLDCFGQGDGAIFVETQGGVSPFQFSLDGGDWQVAEAFSNLNAGSYELTAQDANGCETSEIIFINAPLPVDVELGDDLEIKLGDGATLNAIVNVPFDSLAGVFWQGLDSAECPACLTQPVFPLVTTTYSVSVTSESGCTDDDAVTVIVDRRKGIFVPNAFSPNTDGLNDVIMIFADPKIVVKIKRFLLFNRWGETVYEYYNFEPNNPAYGWDGKHRGKPMDPAVFVWYAEVEFLDGKTVLFEGDVTLLR